MDQSTWYGAYLLCTGNVKIVKSVSIDKKLRCAGGHEMRKRIGMEVGKHCVECGQPIIDEFDVEKKVEEDANFSFSPDNKDGDFEPVLNEIDLGDGKTVYISNMPDGTINSINTDENVAKEMKDKAFYRDKFMAKLGKYIDILKKYHDTVELKVGIVVNHD